MTVLLFEDTGEYLVALNLQFVDVKNIKLHSQFLWDPLLACARLRMTGGGGHSERSEESLP